MTILYLLFSLVFGFLAILPFRTFEVRWFWLLSVVVTEYGQWLAILTAAGWLLALARRDRYGSTAALIFFASSIVFLVPTVTMYAKVGGWQRQLRRAFGGTLAESGFAEPDPLRLWLGRTLSTPREPVERRYVTRNGVDLKLDVYPPDATAPAPWVLAIHGGGWNSGTKRDLPELNSFLAQRGVGVISVEYRLAPTSPWPAARDDVRSAIEYVKAHAAEFNLDPHRYVLLGRSAGGQLAQMVAFAKRDPDLRGCVSLYAPTDMVKAYEWGREDDILGSRPLVREYMGGPPDALPKPYHDASALDFVGPKSPPTLLIHGARDPLVWIRHSERLRDRLSEVGVANALIDVPWGTHGLDYNLWGPGGQTLTITLEYFLRRVF